MTNEYHITVNVFGPFGQDGISQILAQLDDIKHRLRDVVSQEKTMTQATDDLDAVVQALGDTVNNVVVPGLVTVGTAIDALVAAQGVSDDAEVEKQVALLQSLVPSLTGSLTSLQGHMPTLATAATQAAQAPADPNASIVAPAPVDQTDTASAAS